jgi:hypothetical protein
VVPLRNFGKEGGVRNTRRDSGIANTELGAHFSYMLLMAFRAPHYRRGRLLDAVPSRPFVRRTEKTRETIAERLGFFVSLPHGSGQRDRATDTTAAHFGVDRRTIQRHLEMATRTLKKAAGQQHFFQRYMANWALSVLEGREDKTISQVVEESSRGRKAGANCGLLSMSS